MNRFIFLILVLFSAISLPAQEVQMADTFRNEGKINVVIAVISIVFACVLGILLYLERRLSKIEKEINESKS